MKNNIKKLALIIFFFNNSFKIFSSPERPVINPKQKRKKQRAAVEAEKQNNQLIFVGGFILLYIIVDNLKWQNIISQDKKLESAIEEIIPGDNIKKYLDLSVDSFDQIIINLTNNEKENIDLYIYVFTKIINNIWDNKQIITEFIEINKDKIKDRLWLNTKPANIDTNLILKIINLNSIFINNSNQEETAEIQTKNRMFFNYVNKTDRQIINVKNENLYKKLFNFFKINKEKFFFLFENNNFKIFDILFFPQEKIYNGILYTFLSLFCNKTEFFKKYNNNSEDKKVILEYINIIDKMNIHEKKFDETRKNLKNFCIN